MKTQLRNLLFATSFFSTIIFISCEPEDSVNVSQDEIYTEYDVIYDSNADMTLVIVRFVDGSAQGSYLKLSDAASISFNGQQLLYNSIFFGNMMQFEGIVGSGTFIYTDAEGKDYVNEMPDLESVEFPDDLTNLSKSQAYDFSWEGTSLSANQNFRLSINENGGGDGADFELTGEGISSLVLGVDELSKLSNGTSSFSMNRDTKIEVVQGTSAGGHIRSSYSALNIFVEVID